MANILLTFLGRNRYERCVYFNPQTKEKSSVVRFVQEAICQLNCQQWTEQDRIIIFLTKDARKANWEGSVYEKEADDPHGLEYKLSTLGLKATIETHEIKEGFDENEIWENFKTIYDCINNRDAIHLDITNAFRSIPIFATTLVNYAEFLKKGVRLKAVHYGIFEKLGTVREIQEKYPNPNDRLVPILDLKGIAELQDWTNAANDFLLHGNASALAKQAELARFPSSREFALNLRALTEAFSTVRGKQITEGAIFSDLHKNIKDIESHAPLPLKPILDRINTELDEFKEGDIFNGFRAIDWCIRHKLYQQGITLMREVIVSYVCQIENRDAQKRRDREVIEKAFGYAKAKRFKPGEAHDLKPEIMRIASTELVQKISPIYNVISFEYRNDINHGGYVANAKESSEFITILVKKYDALKEIIAFDTVTKL
jgi:CRISPR-associated Csx2 family protein